MKVKIKEIAAYLGGTVEGNEEAIVSQFGKIEDAAPGNLTFLANPKYEQYIYETKATAVLVSNDFKPERAVPSTLIRVENPYESLAKLMEFAEKLKEKESGVASTAFVDPSVTLPKDIYIGHAAYISKGAVLHPGVKIFPFVFIGENAEIGAETIVYPSAVVSAECKVGERCVIHSCAVIGADGFGFAPSEEGYRKIPQMGNVIIGDDVEVGACACIDRAVMGSTIVERGVKIDNLVQIAHNVVVNEHTVIAAQVGIAGSTKIGAWNMIGGQSGLTGHMQTAPKVTIAARTGVISDIKEEGVTYFGSPAFPIKKAMRAHAVYGRLPEMDKQLFALSKEVEALRKELDEIKNGSNK